MILKQYYLGCLSHASYLVGDTETGSAVIVDPQRDIDQYLEDSEQLGLTIRYAALTHFHADFVAGHLELRDRVGARIVLGARAKAEYDFLPVEEDDVIELGKVRLQVLETPGHSPESISFVIYDGEQERPHAVLTGDTLFIGDVGRPDLRAALGWTANELGGMLYESLHRKLLPLPDETLVYPAHGAGSLCGKHLSSDTVSTMGTQRQYNYALQPMSKDEFIAVILADQPDAPPYFTYDALLNAKERPTLDQTLARELKPLTLDDVLRLEDAGAQLVDVREPADFAGAHLLGSVNIALSGQFASWAGTVLDVDRPIVIVALPGREDEAALRLGRIGFDQVAGYLDGGMQALGNRPDLVGRIDRIAAATLTEQIDSPEQPLILDVRQPDEWREKRIDGSLNIPLNHLRERLGELPRARKIIVHCAAGYRSSIAASLLAQSGLTNLVDLIGGIGAWEAAQGPMVGAAV